MLVNQGVTQENKTEQEQEKEKVSWLTVYHHSKVVNYSYGIC